MVPRRADDNSSLNLRVTQLMSDFSEVKGAVEKYMELNTQQHHDIKEMIFSSSPNSIQGQINIVSERAFGDNPTSLKSQIADIQGKSKWATGYLAGTFAIFGGLATLIALKWNAVFEFFRLISK